MNHNETFSLQPAVLNSFQKLKEDVEDAMLVAVDYNESFEMETDAIDYWIAATLTKNDAQKQFLTFSFMDWKVYLLMSTIAKEGLTLFCCFFIFIIKYIACVILVIPVILAG